MSLVVPIPAVVLSESLADSPSDVGVLSVSHCVQRFYLRSSWIKPTFLSSSEYWPKFGRGIGGLPFVVAVGDAMRFGTAAVEWVADCSSCSSTTSGSVTGTAQPGRR